MMIANRKHEPARHLTKKASRFNLGGLIKKGITWRKSNEVTGSSLFEVELGLPHRRQYTPPQSISPSSVEISSPLQDPYGVYSHGKNIRHQSSSLDLNRQSDTSSEDRYMACHTECISLLNSEMTSAISHDESEQLSIGDSNSKTILCGLLDHTVVPYDANLEEPASDYRPGGYHPVRVGDQYSSKLGRYKVIRKLGWGHFSTVWLCTSVLTGELVAMKIVKLGPNYSDAARDEINILHVLQGPYIPGPNVCTAVENNNNIVKLLDDFQIRGPNGNHLVMVFELMGENLLHFVYSQRAQKLSSLNPIQKKSPHMLPMRVVKVIIKQTLQSVHFMHQRGVVHTDLKPENILLTHKRGFSNISLLMPGLSQKFQILPSQPLTHCDARDDSELTLKIADLGNATYSDLHFTNNIQTRQYRAPEILLKYKSWGALADVWSIGCLAFELLTGDYLFDPKDGVTFTKDEDHLAQIIELLGEFPSPQYLSNCELASEYFIDSQNMQNISTLKFWPLKHVLVEKYKFDAEDDEVKLFCDFMTKCLRYNLNERYDCGSLLAHPWFENQGNFDKYACDQLPNKNKEIIGFTTEE